ncbi:MAG: phosphoribosylformylglycinamidine synthase [Desulfobulbus oligotrophicus]|jgi:phosphoribosylformylglycinamidine synthase|nr:phosphoribosylformylglycinamidine synthase [Desulfobulbus oligotrophicus]
MAALVIQLHRQFTPDFAYCFYIASNRPLEKQEIERLRLVMADGFLIDTVTLEPQLTGPRVVEIGPRLNFATAWSSNMVSICHAIGLQAITRVERSRRYLVPDDEAIETFIAKNHDRMTECRYLAPLTDFETGTIPEPVYEVDLKSKGPDGLLDLPGVSMDEWDRELYYNYFVNQSGRNPTIVEIMDLNNANSEHSRHGFFRGKQVIDGKTCDTTLFQVVAGTLAANPKGSKVAFKDNSSVIEGFTLTTLLPERPGEPSPLVEASVCYHPLLTAETHNFPTGVAPFPGGETGTGGRIRDVQCTGQGALVGIGTAGYCVANLHIPDYPLEWENEYACPDTLASALEIIIEASNGASDYGNKFGEPLVQGFTRSFDLDLESGGRWGFLKPVMFTGGIGQIDDRHTEKKQAVKGMLIVQIGGPAYRVGFGGGAASSMIQGENESTLDFDAVQRGDAKMEQKLNRVIRACNEMGERTLIDVIHDQGAGGPANVLKELVEHAGGRVEIRNINVGDPTMSVLEIYVAEYQERVGLLISPENIERFQTICEREKVPCEILGEVTGDLRFVVHDRHNNTTPVNIEIPALLGNIPQKTFTDTRVTSALSPFVPPRSMNVREALHKVLRLISVGSKRFLTNKVDRSVTGLIAQQQCCGPLQLTVADVAVTAQSHFSHTGIATAIGEQPIKMLIDPAAGARMAVGEALTNLVWARIRNLEEVKCSANWMWAPKLTGEGAALRDAAEAMAAAMIKIGIAVDGGKDSLSMATKVGDEVVKSPRQLVISLYAAMADIRKKVTPDIKEPGSALLFVDLSGNNHRLGGSALAQTCGQIGDVVPDMDDPALIRKAFGAVQYLIERELILSGHDRSDGGLITTVLEMAFSGNCGLNLALNGTASILETLFNEELGLVIECRWNHLAEVKERFAQAQIPCTVLGTSTAKQAISLQYNGQLVLDDSMILLRQWWEETSYQLERLQMDPAHAEAEKTHIFARKGPTYHLSFSPEITAPEILLSTDKPKVAILREEGSNSDREMSSAFYSAGFEPWDVTMTDLLTGRVKLTEFRGLAVVGGFSFADVPESAKGWAATIRFNEHLQTIFHDFYNRPDTFTLGVCNGCQLFGLLGWVPWQGIEAERQPRFIHNRSGRFESRWSTVKVLPSRSIMLAGMEDLVFGISVNHGEGCLHFPDTSIQQRVWSEQMAAMVFVDDEGQPTEQYPFNPNGSPGGLTAVCSPDGRHLALMPHPERTFLTWQCHWLPETMQGLPASPWLRMFQNAYTWCRR